MEKGHGDFIKTIQESGDLIVTEFMAHSADCADGRAEYIEFRNNTTSDVDLFGLQLQVGADQDAEQPVRQHQSKAGSEQGQQGALGQQLPDQPYPIGAEREPDRDLTAALVGAYEEQVGDVGAGDQQHFFF